MLRIKPLLAAAALTVIGTAGLPAFAADQVQPAAASAPRHHGMGVEARIKQLHDKLHVTEAQTDQWNAVAQVMRDNATAYQDLIKTKGDPATMSAVDDLRFYQKIAETHAEGVRKLTEAFEPFYQSLSDEQKKAADAVFRAHKRGQAAH